MLTLITAYATAVGSIFEGETAWQLEARLAAARDAAVQSLHDWARATQPDFDIHGDIQIVGVAVAEPGQGETTLSSNRPYSASINGSFVAAHQANLGLIEAAYANVLASLLSS